MTGMQWKKTNPVYAKLKVTENVLSPSRDSPKLMPISNGLPEDLRSTFFFRNKCFLTPWKTENNQSPITEEEEQGIGKKKIFDQILVLVLGTLELNTPTVHAPYSHLQHRGVNWVKHGA